MFTNAQILTPSFARFETVTIRKGRQCTKCSAQHWDARFQWCRTCRDLNSARTELYRADHKSRGLCVRCVQGQDGNSIRECEHHLEYQRNLYAKNARRQRRAKLCARVCCGNRPAPGRKTCQSHLDRSAKYRDSRKASRRQEAA